MGELKKTPLHEIHRSLRGKMVGFAGFEMPVAYGSIIEEHHTVRERVGFFDVSHMGEVLITGEGMREFVNNLITNDISKLAPGRLQYTVMCRENGTVVDDLLVYVLADDRALLVVNASNVEKDLDHIDSFDKRGVTVDDVSSDLALLAVQGPRARETLLACRLFLKVADRVAGTKYYHGFAFEHEGREVLVSRTGYTGELGFEIFVPADLAKRFWGEVGEAGEKYGIRPIGLGARDTLRFEASFCLYGHELDDETSPLEAGLGWVVKLNKARFSGLSALREEKKNGSVRSLVGFELGGRSIGRQGYGVTRDGVEVGVVTSGTFSPTLQKSLCMAYVRSGELTDDGTFGVDVRGKLVPATLIPLPFYESRARQERGA